LNVLIEKVGNSSVTNVILRSLVTMC